LPRLAARSGPLGYFGFATETAPIDDDLTIRALLRQLNEQAISRDVLRAFVDLSPDARWVVDEMILAVAVAVAVAVATADRRRHHQRPQVG
jgi:hypothetical protein